MPGSFLFHFILSLIETWILIISWSILEMRHKRAFFDSSSFPKCYIYLMKEGGLSRNIDLHFVDSEYGCIIVCRSSCRCGTSNSIQNWRLRNVRGCWRLLIRISAHFRLFQSYKAVSWRCYLYIVVLSNPLRNIVLGKIGHVWGNLKLRTDYVH